MGIVKALGSPGQWLTDTANTGPASKGRKSKRVWVEFTGTDGTKIDSVGGQDGAFPAPGVTGVEVAFKGSLGSLREVTVNYQCWTKSQLEAMSNAYMQLGRTAAVSFGWSIDDQGSRVSTGALNVVGSALNDFEANARTVAESNRGCVASYKGFVDNFSFSLNADGGFDCVCHFITPAQAAFDVDMTIAEPGTACAEKTSDDTEQSQKNSNAIQLVKSWVKVVQDEGGVNAPDVVKMTLERETTEDDDTPWWSGIAGFFGNTAIDTDTAFFRWGWIEQTLINGNIMPVNAKSTDKLLSGQKAGEPMPMFYLDSEGEYLTQDATTLCFDILSCWAEGWTPNTTRYHSGAPSQASSLKAPEGASQWDGQMTNIYVSQMLLLQCLREAEQLSDFMDNILPKINQAMNGRWDLQMVADADDPRRLKIIDAGNIPSEGVSSTELNIYGLNGIARSVTLDTSVPNGIKAQLIYGSNSSGTGKSTNEGSAFRFQPGEDQITPVEMQQPKPQCAEPAEEDDGDPLEPVIDALDEFLGAVTPDSITAMRSAWNNYYADQFAADENQGDATLIPITLGIEVDGIEGIPYGALIQGNYIPAQYKSEADFMVTGVGHSVSADGWVTTIDTIMRRK